MTGCMRCGETDPSKRGGRCQNVGGSSHDWAEARKRVVTVTCPDDVTVSDGYHTFDELYEHRFELWIALCLEIEPRRMPWRSRLHDDGMSYPGWFVLGVGHEPGRIVTYHLPDRLWDRCDFAQTVERGVFDGHTSADVLKRLRDL